VLTEYGKGGSKSGHQYEGIVLQTAETFELAVSDIDQQV
jgi:hypothetical protein